MAARNRAKADLLYGAIDTSGLYRNPVERTCRSWMNVPFTLERPGLEKHFLSEAAAEGLTAEDLRVANRAMKTGGAAVFALNNWVLRAESGRGPGGGADEPGGAGEAGAPAQRARPPRRGARAQSRDPGSAQPALWRAAGSDLGVVRQIRLHCAGQ